MLFGEHSLLVPLLPSVVNTPCPQMGYSFGARVVVFFTFYLFGVPGLLAWLMFAVSPLELDGLKFTLFHYLM